MESNGTINPTPARAPLQDGERHLLVSPAGAYFAVSANDPDPLRDALLALLAQPAAAASALPPPEVLEQLRQTEWVEFAAHAAAALSAEPLERLLLDLLPALSGDGCALLADHQGLQIAGTGFEERQGQRLAALSSEAIALGLRHRQLMRSANSRTPAAWAMVDAAGSSLIGVWPLFVGERWFALVIGGRPLFTRPAFVQLVRTLVRQAALSSNSKPAGFRPAISC